MGRAGQSAYLTGACFTVLELAGGGRSGKWPGSPTRIPGRIRLVNGGTSFGFAGLKFARFGGGSGPKIPTWWERRPKCSSFVIIASIRDGSTGVTGKRRIWQLRTRLRVRGERAPSFVRARTPAPTQSGFRNREECGGRSLHKKVARGPLSRELADPVHFPRLSAVCRKGLFRAR